MELKQKCTIKNIDLNCDLGEGYDDKAIMPYISSCNVACGGHYGDIDSIEESLVLAKRFKVHAGAHPSFPDKANFGRKFMKMNKRELLDSLEEQLLLFRRAQQKVKLPFHHIKWHGALYNLAASNAFIAQILAQFIKDNYPSTLLYVPFGSKMDKACMNLGIPVWYEVFADRVYADDLCLVPRAEHRSVIEDPVDIKNQVISMLEKMQVRTIGGKTATIQAQTICVHGDHPKALAVAKELYYFLREKNYHIK